MTHHCSACGAPSAEEASLCQTCESTTETEAETVSDVPEPTPASGTASPGPLRYRPPTEAFVSRLLPADIYDWTYDNGSDSLFEWLPGIDPAQVPPRVVRSMAEEEGADISFFAALTLARCPAAPADVLTRLAMMHPTEDWEELWPQVISAVAMNPSTAEATRNMVFARALAAPEESSEIDITRTLITSSVCPSHVRTTLLQTLAGSSSEYSRARAAENPHTPPHLLSSLAADEEARVRAAAASNPNTPAKSLARLFAASKSATESAQNADLLINLASNPSTPTKVLRSLADQRNYQILANLAENPATPTVTRTKVAQQVADAEAIRRGADPATDPTTYPDVLVLLAASADPKVRATVAVNPATPVGTLTDLAADPDVAVQGGAAANPNTPIDILIQLGEYRDLGDPAVGGLLENPRTPPQTLVEVLRSWRKWFPYGSYENDSIHRVYHPLIRRFDLDDFSEGVPKVRTSTGRPVNPDDLVAIANVPICGVRSIVASHPATPRSVVELLAKRERTRIDANPAVRWLANRRLRSDG